MKKSLVANLYNPHEQNKEQLITSFVVRQNVFQELFQEIKSADITRPTQHYLIEGQRGMGKTTLLLRLSYEIENDPNLRQWCIPVVLKEEAYYGIRRLCALWETLAQELEEKEKLFAGLAERMAEAYEYSADYEPACFKILSEALEQHEKKILLFIDNLGEMLLNFSDQEIRRFHDVLVESPYIRLIGATPVIFEAFLPESHLFASFFTTIRLEGLNKEETRSLLRELAKVYKQERTIRSILKRHPGRVEALRLLTGGVIRTIVLLFEILTENEAGSAITDLDNILDRVTPLYQSRMKDLTPLQRDVVNVIALNWEAISPEGIARKTRLNPAEVMMALRELETIFIVQPVTADSEHPFYQLKERFFNIWYLMRLAPGTNRSKVLWLLHFLETWYNNEELTHRARQHAEAVAAGRYAAKDAFYLTEAFAKTGQLDIDTEYYMIYETKKLLEEIDIELAAELSPTDKEIFAKAQACYRNEDYEQAAVHYLELKHKTPQMYFQLGDIFEKSGHYQEATESLKNAAEQGHTEAMLRLGRLYHHRLKDFTQAETYYRKAADQGTIEALQYLGNLYYMSMKDYQQAETSYLHVINEAQSRTAVLLSKKFSLSTLKSYLVTAIKGENAEIGRYHIRDFHGTKEQYLRMLQHFRIEAAFQLGNLYTNELKNPELAEKNYAIAAEAGHINAMVNLGFLYQHVLHNPQNAVMHYTKAIEHGEKQYAAANLGALYQDEFQDYGKAEKYYRMAAESGDAGAMNGLAWLYFEQKQHKQEALNYAVTAAEEEYNIYTAHTLACIYLWHDDVERALHTARAFLYREDAYTELEQDILFFLMLLLAKEQYRVVHDYFSTPEMVFPERFQPLYYAYLYFVGNPYYHKLPPELSEPVTDLIDEIKRLAQEY